MKSVSFEQIVEALGDVGVEAGDGLLVHSAVQYLGVPTGGLDMYLQAILSTISPPASRTTHHESRITDHAPRTSHSALRTSPRTSHPAPRTFSGTLAVPAFNFAFARGEPYDPLSTPSAGMGAFSEYVRQLPQALRTSHPMQSLAVIGRYACDLADRDTPSAFDPGSAFERMLELDFKLLLLGADIQAVSMLHYSEQRARVPYRYWKDFSGQVKTPQGWEARTYRMFVRDLDIDAHIELYPVQARLEQRGLWRSTPLNYGQVASCRLVDFVAALDEFLAQDPWSLVTNRPVNSGE